MRTLQERRGSSSWHRGADAARSSGTGAAVGERTSQPRRRARSPSSRSLSSAEGSSCSTAPLPLMTSRDACGRRGRSAGDAQARTDTATCGAGGRARILPAGRGALGLHVARQQAGRERDRRESQARVAHALLFPGPTRDARRKGAAARGAADAGTGGGRRRATPASIGTRVEATRVAPAVILRRPTPAPAPVPPRPRRRSRPRPTPAAGTGRAPRPARPRHPPPPTHPAGWSPRRRSR